MKGGRFAANSALEERRRLRRRLRFSMVITAPSTRQAIDTLPIIDIEPFLAPRGSAAARQAVARELRRVCIDIGFFYLTGHGSATAELDEALARGRDFFRQPLAAKQPLVAGKGPTRFGYFPLGG